MTQILLVIGILIAVPWLAFVIAKFGTYGYYSGRSLFKQEIQNGTKHN